MKQTKLFFWMTAIILLTSAPILADVKIKTRNTVAGQTSESVVYIKGKRQRSEQNFGGLKTSTLTQCDLRRDVQLNTQAKTYFISLYADGNSTSQTNQTTVKNQKSKIQNQTGGVITTTVTLKDTGERKQMFGYTARRILSTMVMESSPDACSVTKTQMETDGWYIDAEFAFDCLLKQQYKPETSSQNSGCQDRQEFKQVGSAKLGYPVYLKTTMRGENGGEDFSSVTEVLEISPATLDAALFEIPGDFREVKNRAGIFTSRTENMNDDNDEDSADEEKPAQTNLNRTIKDKAQTQKYSAANVGANTKNATNPLPQNVGAKKNGVIRIGLATVKTGSVGEGINAGELSAAVQNTFGEYLKGTTIEIVQIDAKLPSQIAAEAAQKSCNFVLYATVSHKKGGGGFGKLLGKIAPAVVDSVPLPTGTYAGNAAIYAGREAVYSASEAAEKVKAKDELSLEINLQSLEQSILSKQFKTKAKSDGEDIISPLIEQAAQTILTAAIK